VQSNASDLPDTGIDRLVAGARRGDAEAWRAIIERHEGLLRAIARRYRLSATDAEDMCQAVWAKLVEHIGDIREPKALPGWIAVTAARECCSVVNLQKRTVAVDPLLSRELSTGAFPQLSGLPASEPDEVAIRAEDEEAVRAGLAELPARDRQLLVLLVADPPVPYTVISRRLGMAVGSIGPTRARSLKRLSETRSVRVVTDVGHGTAA
jgi:RNA polymerase sigma factor (sigma-70 family)